MIKLFEKIRHYFSRESCYTEMEKCGYGMLLWNMGNRLFIRSLS